MAMHSVLYLPHAQLYLTVGYAVVSGPYCNALQCNNRYLYCQFKQFFLKINLMLDFVSFQLLYPRSNDSDRTYLRCPVRAWIQLRRVKERGSGDGYAV
jgi:hypothetical protein